LIKSPFSCYGKGLFYVLIVGVIFFLIGNSRFSYFIKLRYNAI